MSEIPDLQVLSLFDYDPEEVDDIETDHDPTSGAEPEVLRQLTVREGQRFQVLSQELDWWLHVRSFVTQDEGFIPSTCLAPLKKDLTVEQLQALDEGMPLSPSFVNTDVNLKYFPDAPFERHALNRKPCPEQETNIFSRLTFWWLTGLIIAGYKKPLEDSNLWELSTNHKASSIVSRLQQEWEKERRKAKQSRRVHETRNGTRTGSAETACLEPNQDEVSYAGSKREYKPSLVKAMVRVYGPYFGVAVFFKLINDSLLFVQPYLLRLLIQYTEDKNNEEDRWKGYLYVGGMVVVAVTILVALQQYFHIAYSTGMRIRSGVLGTVYAKAIKLNSCARRQTTAGEMVNLMSVDAQRLMELMTNLNLMWSAPLQITMATYFLYDVMGVSVLAGVAVLLLMIPLNLVVTRICRRLQVKQMSRKDERTKTMNEVLSGIKVLKLYAWEESFMKKILGIREEELNYLTRGSYLQSGFSFVFTCAPFLDARWCVYMATYASKSGEMAGFKQVSLATFGVYVMTGNELTATKAFVAIALFNVLRFPISVLPRVIISFVQAQVSVKRLSHFLSQDEIDPDGVVHSIPEHISTQSVHVDDGTFSWGEELEPVLKNINVNITSGSLVAVVGQVGCGKSTLLSALLGETRKLSGEVFVEGRTAYVPQLAWIQNAILRDNILFGRTFNHSKYHRVLRTCALKPDIAVLPAGDMTEIGEKGINLSGGQKQRVSLARAVYFDADVYLLDDPLSAVDSHVGKHIFDKVIGPQGLLKDKTRVLVTHQIRFLPQMDQIIYLQEGHISEAGTFTELMGNEGVFAEFVKTHGSQQNSQECLEKETAFESKPKVRRTKEMWIEDRTRKSFSCELLNGNATSNEMLHKTARNSLSCRALHRYSKLERMDSITSTDCRKQTTPRIVSSLSFASMESILCDGRDVDCLMEETAQDDEEYEKQRENRADDNQELKVDKKMQGKKGGDLITKETSATGKVKFSVFMAYARSLGVFCSVLILLFAIASECFLVSSRVWLADWSTTNVTSTDQRDKYMGVYGALGLGQALGILSYQLILAYAAMKAARNLHLNLLVNIMHSPVTFFETTPLGRIVNRFSKDIHVIDDTIPRTIVWFLKACFTVVGTITVISYSTPLFLTCVVPLGVLYVGFQRVYIASSRQLKRIESVSRSPIYNHFLETINGTSTVRAYSQQNRFIQENYRRIDENQIACYPSLTANRWLAVRLEFIGAIILLFAALFSVVSRQSMSSGLVGLSVTYALQVTGSLNWIVRHTSDLETNIISVERVKEYSETPQEADWVVRDNRPPDNWPHEGRVEIEDLSLRYREELPLALNEVTCHVHGGEKIGIVGRTGAGKSSLTLALFRILESAGGRIVIDDIDISKIGLQDLRSRLTIIPQDPVLFSGSLRTNLDPFDVHSDEMLWHVLDVSQLKGFVSELPDGLSHSISEGGENLSMGQRQLVCLARALLRKSKILVLDEATAAVDLETDEFIQKTIRREFSDRTVLTIAHRLNTIIDCSRILVLDKGRVAEFDTPANLLTIKGIFHDMARSAGLAR